MVGVLGDGVVESDIFGLSENEFAKRPLVDVIDFLQSWKWGRRNVLDEVVNHDLLVIIQYCELGLGNEGTSFPEPFDFTQLALPKTGDIDHLAFVVVKGEYLILSIEVIEDYCGRSGRELGFSGVIERCYRRGCLVLRVIKFKLIAFVVYPLPLPQRLNTYQLFGE